MATVKKSKKKYIIPIVIVLIIAIAVSAFAIYRKQNAGEKASLNTISTGDIHEIVSATGDVTSGASREYKVGSVATVKEVFVSVGDTVKKGDKLATFDTTELDAQIEKLQSTYNSSKKSYNEAVKAQKVAKANLSSVNSRISKLNKEIAKLSKKPAAAATTKTTTKKTTTTTTTTTTAPAQTTVAKYTVTARVTSGQEAMGTVAVGANAAGASSTGTYDAGTTVTFSAQPAVNYAFDGWYDEAGNKLKNSSESRFTVSANKTYYAKFRTAGSSIGDISNALNDIANTIKDLTDDVNTMMDLLQTTSDAISKMLASGITSPDAISKAVEDGIKNAISQGDINAGMLNQSSDEVAATIAKAVQQVDWAKIAKNFTETQNVALTTKQIQLAALTAQKEIYSVQASDTSVNANKEIMNAAGSALNSLRETSDDLQAGWTASFDGTITACDLTKGEQTSLISDGIKLEDMSSMVVTISLSEYDNHKVKVGMPCTIATAYGEYTGEVASKAPTATGGSEGSILDSVGSMAGISGLSSLTSSGAGVECQIKVNNPDENIIIGFNADVDISTGEYIGITVVPIESIKLEKTGTYVYLYNEAEGTATKTLITTGAISDSDYQVLTGIKPGDKIIAAPSSTYDSDTFKVKIVDKSELQDTTTAAE